MKLVQQELTSVASRNALARIAMQAKRASAGALAKIAAPAQAPQLEIRRAQSVPLENIAVRKLRHARTAQEER